MFPRQGSCGLGSPLSPAEGRGGEGRRPPLRRPREGRASPFALPWSGGSFLPRWLTAEAGAGSLWERAGSGAGGRAGRHPRLAPLGKRYLCLVFPLPVGRSRALRCEENGRDSRAGPAGGLYLSESTPQVRFYGRQ